MGKCNLPGCDEWINAATDVYCCELHRIYHKLDKSKEENSRLESELKALRARCERLEGALEKIAGSGPVPTAYDAWSWCYDVAKQALEVPRE